MKTVLVALKSSLLQKDNLSHGSQSKVQPRLQKHLVQNFGYITGTDSLLRARQLPLVKPYMVAVQSNNASAVNESLNEYMWRKKTMTGCVNLSICMIILTKLDLHKSLRNTSFLK